MIGGGYRAAKNQLGEDFAAERARLIDSGCGSIQNVRRIVEAAQKQKG